VRGKTYYGACPPIIRGDGWARRWRRDAFACWGFEPHADAYPCGRRWRGMESGGISVGPSPEAHPHQQRTALFGSVVGGWGVSEQDDIAVSRLHRTGLLRRVFEGWFGKRSMSHRALVHQFGGRVGGLVLPFEQLAREMRFVAGGCRLRTCCGWQIFSSPASHGGVQNRGRNALQIFLPGLRSATERGRRATGHSGRGGR